ncbi:hypothetical protein ABZP36_025637 [Zizania latifolia]
MGEKAVDAVRAVAAATRTAAARRLAARALPDAVTVAVAVSPNPAEAGWDRSSRRGETYLMRKCAFDATEEEGGAEGEPCTDVCDTLRLLHRRHGLRVVGGRQCLHLVHRPIVIVFGDFKATVRPRSHPHGGAPPLPRTDWTAMSEVFEGYERQYCEISASLTRKCTAVSALQGEKLKQKALEIKSGIDGAEALIRKMDLEARNQQPSVRAGLLAKLREYRSDLNNLKGTLKRVSTGNAQQGAREELLESGMVDTLAVCCLF